MGERVYKNTGGAGPEFSSVRIESAPNLNYLSIGMTKMGASSIGPSAFQLSMAQALDLKNQLTGWLAGRVTLSPVVIEGDDLYAR